MLRERSRPILGGLLRRSWKSRWVLMLVPSLIVLGVFFLTPLARLAQLAFYRYDPVWIYRPETTLGNFSKFISDMYYWKMVYNTLKVGFLTTICTLSIAYPIAYYLAHCKPRERTILSAGFIGGLFVTMLVTTLGWYILFLPFGLIQQGLKAVGLSTGPIRLLKTFPALIAVLTHLHMPYSILVLAASIQAVPKEKIDAARILGAPTWRVFTKVLFPLTMPGVVSSAVLVFALSASSYLVPILITGQSIALLPIGIWRYTHELLNWPFAAVTALILFVLTMSASYGFIALTNRLSRRGKWEMV